MGYFTHKYGKIDHLDSHNEYWLETEAQLRTDFNIKGVKTDQIERIKRKSAMKGVFIKAGIKVARGRVCKTIGDVFALITEVGYPVVAKPDIGVGAAQTYKLENEEQVRSYWQDKPAIDYIVEEYIDGRVVTFDGLTDADGNIVFSSTLAYSKGVMDAVNEDSDIHYSLTAHIPPALEQAGLATLRAFDVRARFFHFEYFVTEADEIVALEVNMRPPGGLTLDMFNYLFEDDCYRTWAEMIVNGVVHRLGQPDRSVIYVGRKDHIAYSMSHAEVIDSFRTLLVHHERMSPVLARALGNDGYVLCATQPADLHAAAECIQRRSV
jgi:hypothetical protein